MDSFATIGCVCRIRICAGCIGTYTDKQLADSVSVNIVIRKEQLAQAKEMIPKQNIRIEIAVSFLIGRYVSLPVFMIYRAGRPVILKKCLIYSVSGNSFLLSG